MEAYDRLPSQSANASAPNCPCLEKDERLAKHQTAQFRCPAFGIYYKPGSLKAVNCRQGKRLWKPSVRNRALSMSCGSIIVALRDEEIPSVGKYLQEGRETVNCKMISREEMLEIEGMLRDCKPFGFGSGSRKLPSSLPQVR